MITCRSSIEPWAMNEPFEIAREVITEQPVLMVSLSDSLGHTGRAEAAGVDYDGETPQSMALQIATVLDQLHDGIDGKALMDMLPAGGARNARAIGRCDSRNNLTPSCRSDDKLRDSPPGAIPQARWSARTRATCRASRPLPSAIWWRQLVPSATMQASGALRTAGSRVSSAICIEISWWAAS